MCLSLLAQCPTYSSTMADATVIPTWLAILLAVGTPVLTFVGVLLANRVSRKGDQETETRSLREETMRNLRWAAELALDDDPKRALLGFNQLQALEVADMLDEEQKVFVTAALDAVVAEPESTIEELAGAGEDVIVEVAGSASGEVTWAGTAHGHASGVDLGDEDGGGDDG